MTDVMADVKRDPVRCGLDTVRYHWHEGDVGFWDEPA